MSDQQAHTKEPWEVWKGHADIFAGPLKENERTHIKGARGQVATCEYGEWMDVEDDLENEERNHANAARIVACVNGCAGLNPAGVKGAVEALEHAITILDAVYDDEPYSLEMADLADFRAALAKLREDS